eukprot:405116-Ditylum_brightwellii.AAC.1
MDDHFPFLDMKLTWKEDDLKFSVYNKENQTIKYLSSKSCHMLEVYMSNTSGCIHLLGKVDVVNRGK